jgi:hypothetical protein
MTAQVVTFVSPTHLGAEESATPIGEQIGTNVKRHVLAFDDTTQEYGSGSFFVTQTLDTAGTVTIRAAVQAKTHAAAKNCELRFEHSAIADGEDGDAAAPYTVEDSGDKALDATAGHVTIFTWTETVANLGWVAGDLVRFRISRIDASADDLAGDLYLENVTIRIPETSRLDSVEWEDLRVPLTTTKLAGNDPSFEVFQDDGGGPATRGVWAYAFVHNATKEVFFECQIPHSYAEVSNIYPHVHWAPSTADAGTVRWGLEYTWANIDAAFPTTTIIYVNDDAAGTAKTHQVASFSNIAGAGQTISSMLACRLFRDTASGDDDYDYKAFLLEFDFHIQVDSLGSDAESSKT